MREGNKAETNNNVHDKHISMVNDRDQETDRLRQVIEKEMLKVESVGPPLLELLRHRAALSVAVSSSSMATFLSCYEYMNAYLQAMNPDLNNRKKNEKEKQVRKVQVTSVTNFLDLTTLQFSSSTFSASLHFRPYLVTTLPEPHHRATPFVALLPLVTHRSAGHPLPKALLLTCVKSFPSHWPSKPAAIHTSAGRRPLLAFYLPVGPLLQELRRHHAVLTGVVSSSSMATSLSPVFLSLSQHRPLHPLRRLSDGHRLGVLHGRLGLGGIAIVHYNNTPFDQYSIIRSAKSRRIPFASDTIFKSPSDFIDSGDDFASSPCVFVT
ncbi:hypothetical protein Syun_009344 [Stephania yunnanensis]|uniref:Uncharacterized protein n=1 Tax=Stephania yunnanensis TaxID=152371 RepID=A0AAP0KGY8_9MAGN